MNEKKQGYILRYYLPVKPHFDEEYTEKRFCKLLELCQRASIDAVMLYVALDPNWYYISDTPEYARECREQMIPYIKRLRKAGISYQLNFQNLVGSTLGGVDFSKFFSWKNLVDQKGRESLGCGCPIDKNFRRETGERLKIWAETEPDIIWIDDDLRYHNHGTPFFAALEREKSYRDYYCFCDEHLRLFNEKNKTELDRARLIAEMTKKGEPSDIRAKYLDHLNETMCDTARWIRQTVKSVSPKTKIAQMTSNPDVHAAEGRDWNDFLSCLCDEDIPVIRAHFGPYTEKDPRSFSDCYSMLAATVAQIRSQYKKDIKICPEIENTRFTVWAKSARATGLQLDLSAFMGNEDITLSLYDLDGGSFSDEEQYERLLIERKPYLDKLTSLSLFNCEEQGVIIPISPQSGRNFKLYEGESFETIGGRGDGRSRYRYIDKYLLRMAVPCRYVTTDKLDDGVVALDGFSAGFLSDDEIKHVLSHSVFLEADAALTLCRRGFGELIGIKNMEKQNVVVNAERIFDFQRADGTYIRIPSRIPCACWYDVSYTDGAELLSELLTPDGKHYAGMTFFENSLGGKVAIYPACRDLGDGFYTHHRVTLFKNVFERLDKTLVRVDCKGYMLALVKKRCDGTQCYFLANLSADDVDRVSINGKSAECNIGIYETAVFCEECEELHRIL